MSKLKTPLRYPGGKSRAAPLLSEHLPDLGEYRDPFMGGGSMALLVSRLYPGIPVWVNDKYWQLYNFWSQLQSYGEELSDTLATYKTKYDTPEKAEGLFKDCKNTIDEVDDTEAAVFFYIINKCSFSGLTENSSFSKQASVSNFSIRGIENLKEYQKDIQHWKITNEDYSVLLEAKGSKDTFIFLDPPYDIKDFLYGKKGGMHKGFDHKKFAEDCDQCVHNWMITYNINDNIKSLFEGYHQDEFGFTYSMRARKDNKSKKELLITNYTPVPTAVEELFV